MIGGGSKQVTRFPGILLNSGLGIISLGHINTQLGTLPTGKLMSHLPRTVPQNAINKVSAFILRHYEKFKDIPVNNQYLKKSIK